MAGGSLLLLLDDIAAVLDDVSLMSKMAVKKTAGVLGDDLAVNAEQVTGVKADRELPVVWAVAKGSLRNKLILVPAALAISAVAEWLITPLLMLGGLFLCFEGFEKVAHHFQRDDEEARRHHRDHLEHLSADPVPLERQKIRGAIRTDFILSAEIIVLTLGVVADSPFATQVLVLSAIALLMTVGVYGLVAGIVKLDDAGLYLTRKTGEGAWPGFQRWFGRRLLAFAPVLMKTLSIVGTAAMFLVGGGILVHGLHFLDVFLRELAQRWSGLELVGPLLGAVTPALGGALVGLLAGFLVLLLVRLAGRLRAALG